MLIATTAMLAAVAAVPTAWIAGTDELAMLGLGAGVALVVVLGGWFIARVALRGPDRFATKLVVGGFLIRLALLFLVLTALVGAGGVPPARFVLWLVSFYFALIMAEAWMLARDQVSIREEGPTR